ncbi:MAG: hypothetical protein EBX64_09980 [Betaproteobacteria bacterium]|nr:hypothetical protein [Betaproteobacteria bacterium]
MSTESAFLRFRAFMTPGRTLSAMLFLFIALPSVVVWSGVASFGAASLRHRGCKAAANSRLPTAVT